MDVSGQRRRRLFSLAMTAVGVTAAITFSGCAGSGAGSSGATGAPTSAPGSASPGTGTQGTGTQSTGTQSTGTQSTGQGTAACGADYCTPADWDTARASTPLPQIPPFIEPINVVIGARSSVPLAEIQQALSSWKTVSTATMVNLGGIHLKCISSEMANVTGHGYVAQTVAWRLGGCLDGNELSLSGNEDHVRIWNQPVAGSKYGAWFVAASYETMCVVKDGQLQTASAHKVYAALHPGSVYHCVDGGPGSSHAAHADGYDDAAADFAAAVVTAGHGRGWKVSERMITVKRGADAGEGSVPFKDTVYVLTVTA
jgi:hypothetical protein